MVRWLIGIVVVGLVGAGAWWLAVSGGVPVETATASRGTVRAYVEELAETRLPRTHTISMPMDGRVLPIEVEAGEEVSAGQVVARLDTTAPASLVAEQEARIARLEAEIERSVDARVERTLIEQIEAVIVSVQQAVKAAEEQTRASRARLDLAAEERADVEASMEAGAATDLELRRARVAEVASDVALKESLLTYRGTQAVLTAASIGPRLIGEMIDLKALDRAALERELAGARARLVRLKDDLQRATLASPVDGVVLTRLEDSERVLPAGTPLIEVGRLEALEVEIEMLTDEAGLVSVGDPVEVSWPAAAGPVAGRVSRIEPRAFTKVSSLGVEQQRVLVIVSLEEGALAGLRSAGRGPGAAYRVRTRVFTDEGEGLVVARGAVFRGADGAWRAFRVRGGRAHLVEVSIGLINPERALVTEGLDAGDELIVSPPVELDDGQRVRVAGGVG